MTALVTFFIILLIVLYLWLIWIMMDIFKK